MHTDDDDPWQDDISSAPGAQKAGADADWDRLQSSFTTAGYREGITAGKEGALQVGFDAGFARVGAPLGRALGALRGRAAAVLAILAASPPSRADLLASAREIAAGLSDVRFSDIAPPDVEAERHAREHLASADAPAENEEIAHRRDMEGLEDMLAGLSAGADATAGARRLGPSDVKGLEERLDALCAQLTVAHSS